MTEREFNELADAVFRHIEQTVDASGEGIECNVNGLVLELDLANGLQIVINRHNPSQEIWLAARSGGFHYAYHNGRWLNGRDGSELFTKLEELTHLRLT